MARVLDALQQLDTLAARPAGPAIADDDIFLADNGHMVKTHPLAASTARLRLLDMAWEAAPPSTTTTTTSAAGAGPCAPEAAALLSQMIAELRKVLALSLSLTHSSLSHSSLSLVPRCGRCWRGIRTSTTRTSG
jgi:hypothetical protein